jgi:hypothetical protein
MGSCTRACCSRRYEQHQCQAWRACVLQQAGKQGGSFSGSARAVVMDPLTGASGEGRQSGTSQVAMWLWLMSTWLTSPPDLTLSCSHTLLSLPPLTPSSRLTGGPKSGSHLDTWRPVPPAESRTASGCVQLGCTCIVAWLLLTSLGRV